MRNIPKERRSHIHCDRSLKSRVSNFHRSLQAISKFSRWLWEKSSYHPSLYENSNCHRSLWKNSGYHLSLWENSNCHLSLWENFLFPTVSVKFCGISLISCVLSWSTYKIGLNKTIPSSARLFLLPGLTKFLQPPQTAANVSKLMDR
jgi:hypothetical protein